MRQNLSLTEAVLSRRSVRQFASKPVSDETVLQVLNLASRAPSGTNFQAWKVYVANGSVRDTLCASVLDAAKRNDQSVEYTYAPPNLREPYVSRRRKVGYDLYKLHGIDRSDIEARTRVALQNYEFFGAPVGLFFTVDHDLTPGQWLDCGMFMQTVMLVALEFGLDTCPQQAWCNFGGVVHDVLQIPGDEVIVSGMALGYADKDAVVNTLQTERVAAEEFTAFAQPASAIPG